MVNGRKPSFHCTSYILITSCYNMKARLEYKHIRTYVHTTQNFLAWHLRMEPTGHYDWDHSKPVWNMPLLASLAAITRIFWIFAVNSLRSFAATLIWTRQRLGYLCRSDNIPVEARLLRSHVRWMIQYGVPSRAQSSLLCRPDNIPVEARLLRDYVRWMIQDGVPYSCPVFSPVLAKFETIYHVDVIRSIFLSTEAAIILTYFWCVRGYAFIFFHCLMCYLLLTHFPIFCSCVLISLCCIQLTLDAYFIAASVTVSLWSIHTISHFDFGPGWLTGWLAGYGW